MTFKIIPLNERTNSIAGQVFGRSVAIAPIRMDNGSVRWVCVCHCGKVFTRIAGNLKKPDRPSCGCLGSNASHGLRHSREYSIWVHMIQRCTNPNRSRYIDYGGRGITVCTSWLNSFLSFYEDMGISPANTSLDRIDNDGPYCPSNCRWATRAEQARNRKSRARNTKIIAYNGKLLTISEWAKHLGLTDPTIRGRFARGWTLDRALQPRDQANGPV